MGEELEVRRGMRFEEWPAHVRAEIEARRAYRATPEGAEAERLERELDDSDGPKAGTPPDLLPFFASLRAAREQRGLSLADASRLSGIERAMASKLESGRIANPTLATLRAYAKALGVQLVVAIRDPAVVAVSDPKGARGKGRS